VDVTIPVHYGDLDYSNPHRQTVYPCWMGGEVVWSIPLGLVADEYIVVYSVGNGGEKVEGQYTICDSKCRRPVG
jgi:hypothetical protein